ncbi:MAG: immunoglobulin-like domain-containing protein, partial [Clostridium sp.]
MKNFTKKLSMIVVAIFIANFMPVMAYGQDGENVVSINSKFGIEKLTNTKNENGDREIKVVVNEDYAKDISSIKLHTNVALGKGGDGNFQFTILDKFSLDLSRNSTNSFVAELKEENIKEFGGYYIDKIEITYKDNSKKVIYNNYFYDSLSGNDKENGELLYIWSYDWIEAPLKVTNGKLKSKIVKLKEEQVLSFNFETTSQKVEPKKVYVTFKKSESESTRTQVVTAEKVDKLSYEAKLILTNSMDTGNWQVNKIEVVDNYDRTYIVNNDFYDNFKVVSENTDIDAPELVNMELSTNVYDAKIYDKPVFKFEITDDISGFENGTITLVKKDDKNVSKSFGFSNYKDIIDVRIDGVGTNGEYEVQMVSLRDKSGNNISYVAEKYYEDYMDYSDNYIKKDFSEFDIKVINNDEIEKEEIEIVEIVNNNKEVVNGNDINMILKVKSNKDLNYLYMNVKNKNDEIYYSKHLYGNKIETDEDGIVSYEFKGTGSEMEYLASGEYFISELQLNYYENSEYKYKYIYDLRVDVYDETATRFDFIAADFICNNPNEDIVAPKITDITLDKTIVVPGESIDITLKVEDDKSGFIQDEWSFRRPYISYSNVSDNNFININSYDKETNEFKGTITIPEYMSTGKYTISNISINDIASNSEYYSWWDDESKALLSKGTILVKRDLDEMLPPEISVNISSDKMESFKAPFTPIVSADHGTLKMTLNDKEYNGEPIKTVGNYHLLLEATGADGSVSTHKVYFKVIVEITNDTPPDVIVDQIINSPDKEIEIEVNSDDKVIDSSIFEAIKGTDKTISLTQADGTVWTFEGKDITGDDFGDITISVNNAADEENQEDIDGIDPNAKIIHFDYHGTLPGKATVKVKIDNHQDVIGEELTFYYYNPETKKPEKVQGPLSVDKDGYVTVEITHCSDYFLSVDETLADTNEKPEIVAEDIEIKVGDEFDPKKYATANDKEDGTITENIKVIENTVDESKAGVYKVIYEVTDSKGETVTKEIKVTVVQELVEMNSIPEIVANDVKLKVGEKFEPMNNVTAKDKEDGDVTKNIKVIENTVNVDKAGVYKVVYEVVD